MLRHPSHTPPFEPGLRNWVDWFMSDDLSPALDAELSRYNPDDPQDREYLIRQYGLTRRGPRENFRYRQRMVDVLQAALDDPDYDFEQVWEPLEDDYDYEQWPAGWPAVLNDSRDFFQRMLSAARELWHADLTRAQLPSLAECRAIAPRALGSHDWLFNIDNTEAWKAVFDLAATPYDLDTLGPHFQGEQLHLHLSGALPRQPLPALWPTSQALTHCRFTLNIGGISELAVGGTRFDGRMRTQLTRLSPGYYLRLEIGFDCVIECVALSVSIADVQGTREDAR
ncbi:hypothetical protein [Pseudomonas sp. PH1b]|uniref:hypothetical protein n=1 Tax=Pseudomonas sp. PH1b TaxID=1397282 RepID=UPI00046839E7|nr:hypothetical protein [Pseudomonas sp. PH1b]BFD38896.1 hypothetical protein FFPRI1PSEUD_03950 [Pseudomonas sp. FFPRI_1]